MPDNTIASFIASGSVRRSIDADPEASELILRKVAEIGIDLEHVAAVLEEEGVASFVKSFDELIATLTSKADQLL